ncbi:MAG: extracellular solute-binding protein [Clostridiales bacterium]|nr:extracellular solute-binding protein [Clostridiales bacterium]
MKKFLSVVSYVLLLCFLLTAFAACVNNGDTTDQLVVYNWADYIYDYEDDFKTYYKEVTGRDIDITYVTFDTNETMLTRLTQGDSNVDVVCPSEYAIQKLIESNMLVPLNYFDKEAYTASFGSAVTGYVHNSGNIEEGIIDKVSDAFGNLVIGETGETVSMVNYFVPYMYGTLGILYNKYAFEELGIYDADIMNNANWGILFNDDGSGNLLSEGLTGNILMKDSIRDSYAATIFYMLESGKLDGLRNDDGVLYTDLSAGELINAVDDQLLEIVRDVLSEQKQQLFGYEVDFGKDDLLQGNAIVDLAWSGDALYAVEESWDDELGEDGDYELAYYVPHSTGNIWFDGWVVPKTYNPTHLTAIKLFINFLNTPESAAENFMEIGYTPAIRPDVLQNSDEARSVLSEGYLVYDPEYWDVVDESGNSLTVEECDYASWEEFVEYFFDGIDDIDGSNWRYPFLSAELNSSNDRNIDSLGVMRDFGSKNKAVITTWNYARSAGTTALPLLGWTVLAVAVAVGVLFLYILIKRLLSQRVILPKDSNDEQSDA